MAQTKQQFMHINALSTPYAWATPSATSAPQAAPTPGLDSWSLGEDEEASFKALYHKIKAFVESSEAMDEVCIVVDNLSILLETCQRPALVIDFIHYLQVLVRRPEVRFIIIYYLFCDYLLFIYIYFVLLHCGPYQNRASLVVLVHGDVEDDGKLVKSLEHKADFIMAASGLSSGYSKEVTGQVRALFFFPAAVRRT
jgi:hypothetical protein